MTRPGVTKARDFDHALELANATDYGLTGAVYTNNPEKIAKAKEQFFVGNLYINRKCTGAMVGAHPSEASTCPVPIPRPAARTTCSGSSRPRALRRR